MTEIEYSPLWADDDRTPPAPTADERELLTGTLDYYRRTLELKCLGLSPEQVSQRSVEPSSMSLHGLVRHLTGVERWWFRMQLNGERDLPMLYYSDDDPDLEFNDVSGDVEEALAAWRAECDVSRAIVAALPSLDETGVRLRDGAPISARWVLLRLITEYAQHCGHADLLRERLDGRTGQ